ncbi:MAG: phosphoenolpyruvate--protein phosphotransferase [Epulopiscium sp. Nuni2H_MBin001]|nr:MAG: phosphoenolpyruvate--protein phosphotransferase [Epulopiscium sp. Nuni2H_MBin001]
MKLTGIGASNGIAIGKVFIKKEEELQIPTHTVTDVEGEVVFFKDAIVKATKMLEKLYIKAKTDVGEEEAKIFEVHQMLLQDDDYIEGCEEIIRSDNANAIHAVSQIQATFVAMFEAMEDPYLRERGADIRDISKRVMGILANKEEMSLSEIDYEAIVVAKDLYPSDTIQMDKNYVVGFITEDGGKMSHSAILARTMQIPAIVGMENAMNKLNNGDIIILDGSTGEVLINPSEEVIAEYRQKRQAIEEYKKSLLALIGTKSVTRDGREIEICANIGSPKDVPAVLENDAEGVGLFRSEFLYMDSAVLPTEDEQFAAYKAAVEGLGGKRVIIRTLDVGGDKEIPYLHIPKEENPFLGYRAIRVCLVETDMFKTQLRALLRSSVYGKLAIMVPMIISVDEIRATKKLIKICKDELIAEGHKVSDDIEVGIMIETPAAVMVADMLAKEVDFFSVGTNDLTQYILAADRMNPKLAHLYDTRNPAVLRAIKKVAEDAHNAGIWIGICGEAGADTRLTGFFAAVGIDELSVSPGSVLEVRKTVQSISVEEEKAKYFRKRSN